MVSLLYKFLAKVLSLRLKEVLGETIDSSQGAFVQRSQILDLFSNANEVIEEYMLKKKEGIVFKVDFEKEYDHISWEFLDFVLETKGFGFKRRMWIKGCLSSANFSVIINGKPKGHFGASRGVRQGDPSSPSLFILVADVLSRLMKRACDRDLLKGFEMGCDKVRFFFFFIENKILYRSAKGIIKQSLLINSG